MLEKIKFYQTGSNTVGNRMLNPAMRTNQASEDRNNSLISGHRACQGCGEALGARYAIDAAMKATNGPTSCDVPPVAIAPEVKLPAAVYLPPPIDEGLWLLRHPSPKA